MMDAGSVSLPRRRFQAIYSSFYFCCAPACSRNLAAFAVVHTLDPGIVILLYGEKNAVAFPKDFHALAGLCVHYEQDYRASLESLH